jgi:FkbM family methyltransferase
MILTYYFRRVLGFTISPVVSNWIYFLKIAHTQNIRISNHNTSYIIANGKFRHSAEIRKGESSDILVYLQICFNEEYFPVLETAADKQVLNIVDVGANVGFFSVWMQAYFPEAKYICIEPSETSCSQIKKQCLLNNFENLSVHVGALWPYDTMLAIKSRYDGLEWNNYVSASASGTIPGVNLDTIIRKYNLSAIDILKIDIEGAEILLFEDEAFIKCLRKSVHVIAMETHDEKEKEFIKLKLAEAGFAVKEFNELLFARKNEATG